MMLSGSKRQWASGQMDDDVYQAVYGQASARLKSNQVRLLRVLPIDDTTGSKLKCELRVVSLDSSPEYAALSYTWGTQPFNRTVECTGSCLPVTQSCFDALVAFRGTGWQMIWIDQLCIDQSSFEERGQQITLMGRIYSQALRVFVWLGPFAQDSGGAQTAGEARKVAMKVITMIHWLAQLKGRELRELVFPVTETRTVGTTTDEAWAAFVDLFTRAYWRRRWIIQEAVLNDNVEVLFGDLRFPLSMLSECLLVLHTMLRPPAGMRAIIDIPPALSTTLLKDLRVQLVSVLNIQQIGLWLRRLRLTGSGGGCLLFAQTLDAAWGYQITDPRDVMYALRGLIPDSEQHLLPAPDYTLSRADVMVQHAHYLISGNLGGYVLESAGRMWNPSTDLPSWCPDWAAEVTGMRKLSKTNWEHSVNFVDVQDRFAYQILAAGSTKTTILSDADANVIHVSGFAVDTVVAVAPLTEPGEGVMFRYAEFVAFVATHSREKNFWSDKVFELMCMLQNSGTSFQWSHWSKSFINIHELFDLVLRTFYIPSVLELESPFPASHPIAMIMDEECRVRRLCATKEGYIGILPQGTREGDFVVVFFGVNTPMVIRQSRMKPISYEVIGDCYILGLTHGKALELESCQHPEMFRLV